MGPEQLQTSSQWIRTASDSRPGQEQSYQLMSSTRFDPFLATLSWNNDHDGPCSFFLLPYHFDRLASAAKTHKWDLTLSYDYLKSTCLDVVSKEQQRLPNGSSSAFKVNLCIPFFFSFFVLQKSQTFVGSNHTFTRWSNCRDCNPFDNDFHVRSNSTFIR